MGFIFKKSYNFGFFRANFSKKGISLSTKVSGINFNTGTNGTFVTFGANGIYYRHKISSSQKRKKVVNYNNKIYTFSEVKNISSSDVEYITDVNSKDFINELTNNNNKISFAKWFGILPLFFLIIFISIYFFKKEKSEIKYNLLQENYYILPKSKTNVFINSNIKKTKIGIVGTKDKFILMSEQHKDFFEINFKGKSGFVLKKDVKKISITNSYEQIFKFNNKNIYQLNPQLFWKIISFYLIFSLFLLIIMTMWDNNRRIINLYYNFENGVYDNFINQFSEILVCSKVWQYRKIIKTKDYKYDSGAESLIDRIPVQNISTNKLPSNIIKTNIQIPSIGLLNTELFFFPEMLVIKKENKFGAILYNNIQIQKTISNFIETEIVPIDANVVSNTWLYLNKNGEPDLRFTNNYEVPICQYSKYHFYSESGLNEEISTSIVGAFDNFTNTLRMIGDYQNSNDFNSL